MVKVGRVGWELKRGWKGGLAGWEGKPQCHSINMTLNKRRFKFLNRKQKKKTMWFHSECFQKVCDVIVLHLRRFVPKQRSFLFNMQLKKEVTVISQMIYNNKNSITLFYFRGSLLIEIVLRLFGLLKAVVILQN